MASRLELSELMWDEIDPWMIQIDAQTLRDRWYDHQANLRRIIDPLPREYIDYV